jgi:hypothetical protein
LERRNVILLGESAAVTNQGARTSALPMCGCGHVSALKAQIVVSVRRSSSYPCQKSKQILTGFSEYFDFPRDGEWLLYLVMTFLSYGTDTDQSGKT